MKNIFNTKKSLAAALSRYGRVLSLLIVALMLSNAAWSDTMTFGVQGNWNGGFRSDMTTMVSEGNNTFTYTFAGFQTQSDCWFKLYKNCTGETVNMVYSSVDKFSLGTQYTCTIGQYKELKVDVTESKVYKVTVVYNSDSDVKVTVNEVTGTLPVYKDSKNDGNLVKFAIKGFGASGKYKNTDTYTLTLKSGTTSIDTRYNAAATDFVMFTLHTDYSPLSGTNVFVLTHVQSGDCAEVTFNNTNFYSINTCSSTPPVPTTTAPTVRAGAKPTVNAEGATVNAFLALTGCNGTSDATVKRITAYYAFNATPTITSPSVVITRTDAEEPFAAGTGHNILIPATSLTSTGTYHVKFSALNSADKLSELSDEICFNWSGCTAPTKPTVSAVASAICSGNIPQFNTTTESDVKYQLFTSDHTAASDEVTGDGTQKTITASAAITESTTYYVKATSTKSGCTSYTTNSDNVTITVNALPTAGSTAVTNNTRCAAPYNGTYTITATGGSGSGYTYSNDGGTSYSSTATYSALQSASVTAKVKDSNNCESAGISITVTDSPVALAQYSVTGGGSFCSGGIGVKVGLAGSEEGVTYTLYRGSTSVTSLTGTGSALDFGNQTTAGTYTVKAENATTACTADMTGSATVTVNALPTATITGDDAVCQGGTLTLTGSGAANYSWNGGAYTTTSTFNVTTTTAGPKTITLNVKDANGCESAEAASKTVTINALPTAIITGDDAVCQGGTLTLTGSGAANYSWNGGAYTTTSTFNVTTTSAGEQTITLKVKDDNGCESAEAASKTVTVNAKPTISLAGSGPVQVNETYPWEYITITATTTPDDLQVIWSHESTESPYTIATTESANTKVLKVKSGTVTGGYNESHYINIKANGTSAEGCAATQKNYKIFILSAPAEQCN